jgi:hypothetical protein
VALASISTASTKLGSSSPTPALVCRAVKEAGQTDPETTQTERNAAGSDDDDGLAILQQAFESGLRHPEGAEA